MLCDKRAILQCLGSLMKMPSLLEEYTIEPSDFEVEEFYQIIFSCIYNLYAQDVKIIDCFSIDSYLSNYEHQYKIFEMNHGREYCISAMEIAEPNNFSYYYERLRKFSLLRYWQSKGFDIKNIYDEDISDPDLQEKERQKLDGKSIEELIAEIEYEMVSEPQMRYAKTTISHGQTAGKGMRELKEKLKETPEFGLPMQSPFLTTIGRGMRLGKLYLRSSSSGGGKTRTAMADMCGVAIPWKYNLDKMCWEYSGVSEPALFISTELEIDELQTIILAYVSGIPEDHILDGKYVGGDIEEEKRADEAISYIESSPLYLEVIHDFCINDMTNLIKKYRREKGCLYFCLDYIHMSARLIQEVADMSRGMKLREDQTLFLFIDTLKNLCMKYQIFILTMTQLNGQYKDSPIKDENLLRGQIWACDFLSLSSRGVNSCQNNVLLANGRT